MCRIQMALTLVCLLFSSTVLAATPVTFEVQFDKEVFSEPYSGRVYIFFSQSGGEPRRGPNWFRPEPFLSMDVEDWAPGESLEITTDAVGVRKFPENFDDLNLSQMTAQAVVRFNPHHRLIGTGPGNGYSKPVRLGGEKTILLPIVERVAETTPTDTQRTKFVDIESKLLSDFHGRPVHLRASVTLPANYSQQLEQQYPVIYEIPGFGGTHRSRGSIQQYLQPRKNQRGVDFIKVLLDPSCPRGHHVFANSANNGPNGDALVQELIPYIDEHFRTDARPYGRFLTGHSSGGWSSLWLQVNYPKTFGGTWSTAPDPVDFRDFQRINLYSAGENMYVDGKQQRRPLARMNGKVMLWYDDFALMEDVLGYGGQLHSFEAVFSRRGENGEPEALWDRTTGEIDLQVAESWKKYDINLILEQNWETLKPDLTGKLHVIMGDQDTFYLEGATILLKETLQKLGSDAEVTLIPGRDHMNLFQGGLDQKIEEEIATQYLSHRNSGKSE